MHWTQHMDGHEHALDATILWKMSPWMIRLDGHTHFQINYSFIKSTPSSFIK